MFKCYIAVFICFQDLMNRDKEDELPAMQVKFIDTICLPIYEVTMYQVYDYLKKYTRLIKRISAPSY